MFKPVIVPKNILEVPNWQDELAKFEGLYACEETLAKCCDMLNNYRLMAKMVNDESYAKELIEALESLKSLIIAKMNLGAI